VHRKQLDQKALVERVGKGFFVNCGRERQGFAREIRPRKWHLTGPFDNRKE